MAYQVNEKYYDEGYKEIARPTSGNITGVNFNVNGAPASLDYLSDPSKAGYTGLNADTLGKLAQASGTTLGTGSSDYFDKLRISSSDAASAAIRATGANPSALSDIKTSQPNPTTVNATPFTNDNLQTALGNTKLTGAPPPQEPGLARTAVTSALNTAQNTPTFYKPDPNSAQVVNSKGEKLSYDQYIAQGGKADFSNTKQGGPPIPQQASPLNGIEESLAQDKNYQQLLADRKEYNDVANQSKSLLDFYNKAVTDANIPAINAELINTKKIIEGTENDIRNEVKASSGFATDSQVLALASARNKTLIKNYNALLDTKAMAMESINTMVNLAGQDRSFALSSISQKLQIDQQLNEYRDKFVNNAREGYQNYIKAVGYDGLYNSLASDPQSLALVERTLGLPSGTIQEAARQEQQALQTKANQQTFENQIKLGELDISKQKLGIDRAQLGVSQYNAGVAAGHLALDQKKFAAEQAAANNPNIPTSVAGKPLTQSESAALGYGTRTLQSNKTISDLGNTFAKKPGTPNVSLFGMNLTPNILKSSEQQQYEQAKRNFINATLRRESGAAISPSEFDNGDQQYFPRFGDSQATIVQKAQNRNTVIQNLLREGGQGNVDPTRLTVSPDGQLIQIIQ